MFKRIERRCPIVCEKHNQSFLLDLSNQLESLRRQKDKAKETRELIQYFHEFKETGSSKKLDVLAQSDSFIELLCAAKMINKLNAISHVSITDAEEVATRLGFVCLLGGCFYRFFQLSKGI